MSNTPLPFGTAEPASPTTETTSTVPPGLSVPPEFVPEPPQREGVPLWAFGLILFVLANLVAGGVYLATRGKSAEAASQEPTATSGVALAQRALGLQALERNEFDAAVDAFQRAITAGNGAADLPELLRIAKELQAKAAAPVVAVAPPVAPTPPVDEVDEAEADAETPDAPRQVAKKRPQRARPAPRPEPRPEPAPEPVPEAPRPGLILVTSTPTGLMVSVDGRPADLTPARIELPAGGHSVTIRKGERVLHAREITLSAGGVSAVDFDATRALAELEPKAAPKVEEAPRPEPKPEPPKPKPAVAEADPLPPPAPKPERAVDVGEVEVVSPNVYGEVWVNGARVGFPPIVAKAVPVGSARIEIRVDGAVRKSKTVTVRKNQRVKANVN